MKDWLGKQAPDYSLEDSDGNTHDSADQRGHWLWLVLHRHLG